MSSRHDNPKQNLPSARTIRRTCQKELYRTIKKLKIWIPPTEVAQAEQIYFQKVVLNLPWIAENASNRKKLADWWEENVCRDIAEIWRVEPEELAKAFREAFGG